jgi:hypothetical protein
VRWKWNVDRTWDDLDRLPWPLAFFFGSNYMLALVRDALAYFLILGAAVACLVVGTTLAHYVGAVLITGCLVVALRFFHMHTTWRSRSG